MDTSKKLSQFFSWKEVTNSDIAERLAINNSLPIALIPNVLHTASKMDLIRNTLTTPIRISSWYRSIQLNRKLVSKDTSAHVQGLATDWTSSEFGPPVDVCILLLKYKDIIAWDELILEHTWIHVSFAAPRTIPKKQVLSLLNNGGYSVGLTDKFGVPYVR